MFSDILLRIYQFIVVRWMKLKAKVTNAIKYYVATMEKGFVRSDHIWQQEGIRLQEIKKIIFGE